MKRYLLAATALAAVAIASPAAARDRSAYFGLEVGGLWVTDTDVDFGPVLLDDLDIDHKLGVDGDMIAGYDFGMFRAEAELGYKRSEHKDYDDVGGSFDADGRSSVYSLMGNVMIDVGQDDGISFFAGGGIGYAQVTHVLEDNTPVVGFRTQLRDRGLAWQAIAGVRAVVSQYFDVGLKYRYFNAGNLDDEDGLVDLDSEYKSHSLLLSLIHNFNVPEPAPPPVVLAPPPPPPPPPATQTCPDGSVILATDACPMPPPPPPPPPPEPERG